MTKAMQESKEKALHVLCEEIRRKGGVPWRTAIVDDDRKDFFRGKDLQRYLEAHPSKMEGLVDTSNAVASQIQALVDLMLRTQTVVACDRFYKRPHPGRKHLVKFPRKLAPFTRSDQKWDPEYFYLWMEERPMPPWQYALAVLMVVGILVVCLFPLAPYWLRISVVYFFLGLLAFIFALILVRFLIFLTVFAFTGYEFWLFPNLLSDQVDLVGAFVPLMSFEKPADGKSHLGTRIGGFIGVGFMMYMFYVYTPDESTMKSFEKANESILDMMNNVHRPGLGPGTGYVPPKFGSDRNIDPDQIRQMRFAEKQRLREEAHKRKAAAEAGQPLNDTELEAPTIPDIPVLEDEDDDEDSAVDKEAAAKAKEAKDAAKDAAQDVRTDGMAPPRTEEDISVTHHADGPPSEEVGGEAGAPDGARSTTAAADSDARPAGDTKTPDPANDLVQEAVTDTQAAGGHDSAGGGTDKTAEPDVSGRDKKVETDASGNDVEGVETETAKITGGADKAGSQTKSEGRVLETEDAPHEIPSESGNPAGSGDDPPKGTSGHSQSSDVGTEL